MNASFQLIIAECLNSLYPIIIKEYQNIGTQNLTMIRIFTYGFVSFLFSNKTEIRKIHFSHYLVMSLVTLVHVYFSFLGFLTLPIHLSIPIFYSYTIFNLFFDVESRHLLLYKILAMCGMLFLVFTILKEKQQVENQNLQFGILCMFISAITESLYYLTMKKMKFKNAWDGVFYIYALAAVFSVFFIQNVSIEIFLQIFLLCAIIASFGLYLRFDSIRKLSTMEFGLLSMFGMISVQFYSYFFYHENIDVMTFVLIGYIFLVRFLSQKRY